MHGDDEAGEPKGKNGRYSELLSILNTAYLLDAKSSLQVAPQSRRAGARRLRRFTSDMCRARRKTNMITEKGG